MTLQEKKELLEIAASEARQIAKEEIAAVIKDLTPAPPAKQEPIPENKTALGKEIKK